MTIKSVFDLNIHNFKLSVRQYPVSSMFLFKIIKHLTCRNYFFSADSVEKINK